jgi:malate dehydrogenase (oxaloacetate-decarboxylating)
MTPAPYDLVHTPTGVTARVRTRGPAVLGASPLNRGTAFTLAQRTALGLTGLLPTGVSDLESQHRRVYAQYQAQGSNLRKWVLLTNLRDRNEVLYYKLLSEHLAEMLPVIYTPTVGQAIERFSQEFRRTRGVYLSIDQPDQIETALRNTGLGPDDVDALVATDSEGILGIGDQGIGGIEISIGKLAIYTAAGGIHPRRTLPVVLDVGTDNLHLLNDPLYLGERHARVRDHRYDQFLDAFVAAVRAVFPTAMLHWEDFAATNARRVLHRYTEQICSFNDDLQGTAAVTLAAITSALRVTGQRLSDQRIVIHGAGTSGTGVADLVRDTMIREGLTPDEANQRFWAVDRQGLLVDDDPTLADYQRPYARLRGEIDSWKTTVPGRPIGLAQVVAEVHPTVLSGSSTQGGAFTQDIVTDMAAHVDRPIILPLSNPTSMCEAVPADLLAWTDGRALVATGSPFAPVTHRGTTYRIPQSNNALIFPGLGLGVTVARATRITDTMINAASTAVAELADPTTPGAPLLPLMDDLRTVAASVAVAVAGAAVRDGVARETLTNPVHQVTAAMWHIDYPTLDIVDA